MGRHIAISGVMGAGKSTLVRGIADQLGCLGLEERFEENPYLAGFYAKPSAWAFQSYLFFFTQTLGDYQRARAAEQGGVQERILEEHLHVFGNVWLDRGYIEQSDLDVLRDLTGVVSRLVEPPDLLIHIEIEPQLALDRTWKRASRVEGEISLDYIEALSERYEPFLAGWRGDLLRLDGKRDFREPTVVGEVLGEVDALLGARE